MIERGPSADPGREAGRRSRSRQMRSEFTNETPVPISPGAPSTVASRITVSGLGEAVVEDVDVSVDIEHSWTGDLTISLLNPSGQRVVLSDRRGGRRDDFRDTVFDSDASLPITSGTPPFRGSFPPGGQPRRFPRPAGRRRVDARGQRPRLPGRRPPAPLGPGDHHRRRARARLPDRGALPRRPDGRAAGRLRCRGAALGGDHRGRPAERAGSAARWSTMW